MIICTTVAYFYTTYFIDDLYYSRGSLYVDSSNEKKTQDVSYQNIITSKELIYTYMEVLKSDSFMEIVANKSGLGYSASQLKRMINMTSLNDTEIMEVSIRTTSPESSRKIVQTVLDNANEEMTKIFQGGNVYTVDAASYNESKVYPSIRKNMLIGAVVGFILSALLFFCLELFDTRIKSTADIEAFNLSVLGEIPNMEKTN